MHINRLTAVDVGVAILVHVVRHGALHVSQAGRLDGQDLQGGSGSASRLCHVIVAGSQVTVT